ncbi:hypothetical protein M405DRAFT_889196, partial [Rhizopogon salebrosus TDB-379]
MSSLCKDIGDIKFFRPVGPSLQIKRGLVSAGKTRFGTIYHSGESLCHCLKPIQQLCTETIINIPVCSDHFTTNQFEVALQQLLTVLAPIAKAITCRAAHRTIYSE